MTAGTQRAVSGRPPPAPCPAPALLRHARPDRASLRHDLPCPAIVVFGSYEGGLQWTQLIYNVLRKQTPTKQRGIRLRKWLIDRCVRCSEKSSALLSCFPVKIQIKLDSVNLVQLIYSLYSSNYPFLDFRVQFGWVCLKTALHSRGRIRGTVPR